jgi:hypothetical protein
VCQTLLKAWEISRKAAVLLGFKCFVDFVHYTVSLVYCRMSLAKAELMVLQ